MADFLCDFPDAESQTKEIYARFGLAAYMASVFEEGVAIEIVIRTFVTDLRSIGSEAEWQKQYDAEMKRAHSIPLGPALTRLEALIDLPAELRVLFREALRTRNYLVHHLFRDEIHERYTPAERNRLHDKLMGYVDLFARADRALTDATAELRRKIGLTDEKLRSGLQELETEYRAR